MRLNTHPMKKHTAEEIVAKLRQVETLTAQGKTTQAAIRDIGVTEVTYYRWRRHYGAVSSDQAKRLRDLEKENARLKKLVADQALDNSILKEALQGKY